MPVFNYTKHLREAIDSLRAQTYPGWECVIVDDGSTDDTPALLSALANEEPRIRLLRQESAGPAIARNTALAAIRGDFVQFLDADDLLAPDKLRRHVTAMEAHPEIDLAYGPTAYFDDGRPDVLRQGFRGTAPEPTRINGSGPEVVDVLLMRNVLTIEAPLIRRAVFTDLGAFDEGLRRITDWEFWLRCALAGKSFAFEPSDHPVARIRVHGGSLSYDDLVMHEVEVAMRTKLAEKLVDPDLRRVNERALAQAGASAGIDLALRGNLKSGLRMLLPALTSQKNASWALWAIALLLTPCAPVRRRLQERRHGWRAKVSA